MLGWRQGFVKHEGWGRPCMAQPLGLPVRSNAEDMVTWTDDLIANIDSTER